MVESFQTIFQVSNGLKDCIRLCSLKNSLENISNDMWKSKNGSQDQMLLIAEVRALKSLGAG